MKHQLWNIIQKKIFIYLFLLLKFKTIGMISGKSDNFEKYIITNKEIIDSENIIHLFQTKVNS